MDEIDLPPLPEPAIIGGIGDYRYHYTMPQMRAYGELCMRLAREKALGDAAKMCEKLESGEGVNFFDSDYARGANNCAAAIRALKQESRDE